MKTLLDWLDGKKTYICAMGIAVTYILYSQNIIDKTINDILIGVFGGGGLAALRFKIKKD